MSDKQGVQVFVTRSFAVPADEVFDAWLDPGMIGRWMFGKDVRDEEIVSLTIDERVGGAFSFVVRRQGQEFDHFGRYLEIDSPNLLRFTWGVKNVSTDESEVSVEVRSATRGCILTLTHTLHPSWSDFAERTKEGWTKMLGHLARVLEEE